MHECKVLGDYRGQEILWEGSQESGSAVFWYLVEASPGGDGGSSWRGLAQRRFEQEGFAKCECG